jgi:carbon monoxide dehydrogenase subunit G
MDFYGTRRFDASVEEVWEALLNPMLLKPSIVGCERIERLSDQHYALEAALHVGSLSTNFKGNVFIADAVRHECFTLVFQPNQEMPKTSVTDFDGSSNKSHEFARIKITLHPSQVTGCELKYSFHASKTQTSFVGLGPNLLQGTVLSWAQEFFINLNLETQGRLLLNSSSSTEPRMDPCIPLESNPFARRALWAITSGVAMLLIYFVLTLK